MKRKPWLVLAVLLFAAAAALVTWRLAGRRAIRLDSEQINQLTYTICPHTTNHITLTDRQRISEIAEQFNSLNLKSTDALSGRMSGPDYRLLFFLDGGSTMQLELYAGESAVCLRTDGDTRLFAAQIDKLCEIVDTTCTELLSGTLE